MNYVISIMTDDELVRAITMIRNRNQDDPVMRELCSMIRAELNRRWEGGSHD